MYCRTLLEWEWDGQMDDMAAARQLATDKIALWEAAEI